MFREINEEVLHDVVLAFLNITGTTTLKSVVKSRVQSLVKGYKGPYRECTDYLLSAQLQVPQRVLRLQANFSIPKDGYKEAADKMLLDYTRSEFIQLPTLYQRALWLISNKVILGLKDKETKDLIKVWRPLNIKQEVTCHKCNAPCDDTLCGSCTNKIESCVEYATSSFETIGTTLKPFKYKFKDWEVEAFINGKYTFTRQDKSLVLYQAKLPIEEFKNLLVLI